MRVPFGVQSYQHASLPLSAQRMVNSYLEAAPPSAKTFAAVVQCFGIASLSTLGTGTIRGGLVINGIPYVVCGTSLYRLNELGVGNALGTIPGIGLVDMAGDETNLMVVTRPDAYYYNGSTVQQVTDPDFPGADWVENIDGYYVIAEPNTGRFYVSANRNPASWDALDFATAEKYPDDLVSGIAQLGELILLGKESGEVWVNTGDADFPFERSSAGNFDKGCMSRFGPARVDNSIFFPGHDGIVYKLNGYTPQRVSTTAVEQAIEKAADKDFRGLSWAEHGHTFYGLFSSDFGFVYDVSTNLWWERLSYGLPYWRALFVLRAFNQWIVGDITSNAIGRLSAETFTDFGTVLRSSCTSPPVSDDNRRVTHGRLELVFEQGVGIQLGQGSDPQVMLRWSNDGGRTWSNEYWRDLGKIGEFKRRTIWNRLGQARDRIYEYAISDPVRRTLILATTESQSGAY